MEPKKPIYVDGVDVVGCVRLQDDEKSCDLGGECKGWENCYYKQLARKEYECQRTEQKLILIRDFITDVQIRSSAASVCDKILQIIDEVEDDR